MAVHQNPRSNTHERERTATAAAMPPSVATPSGGARKSAPVGADPEDMVLLREKLNQIAVGRRVSGDNQRDYHMEDSGDEDDFGGARRRRPAPESSPFRMFLPAGERPSTPPSSPQPRDVLRKHLRMKSHTPFYCAPQRSLSLEDNSSDTASDEPLDGMCVDAIEISPLPPGVDGHAVPTHPTVRLSVPEHLRVRTASSSSYSMHTKCPEGFRKRKSVHIDEKDLMIDGHSVVAPLKKVSSQVNVLSSATSVVSSTNSVAGTACDHDMEDASPDPSDSPTDGCT